MPRIEDAPASSNERGQTKLGRAVAFLTATNVLVMGFAFVTSPILARILGPGGRGQVAAVTAVVSIAPWVTEVGLVSFFTREAARKVHPPGDLLGTLGPMIIFGSALAAVFSKPIAEIFSHGRPEVQEWIEIGLIALPPTAIFGAFQSFAVGNERWELVSVTRLLSPACAALGIVILAISHSMSVGTVCLTYMVCGAIATLPLTRAIPTLGKLRFHVSLAFEGLLFGLKSWLATIAGVANGQLDQLLMAATLPSAELGWYALAATLANASNALTSAVANAITPRAAARLEPEMLGLASRLSVIIVGLFGIGGAIVGIPAVPLIFGNAFRPAVGMLQILLLANVIYTPGQVLGAAMVGAGRPGSTTLAQGAGLLVTVPVLLLLLPSMGGTGAAWASLAGYGTVTAVMVLTTRDIFENRWAVSLIPRPSDAVLLVRGARRLLPYGSGGQDAA